MPPATTSHHHSCSSMRRLRALLPATAAAGLLALLVLLNAAALTAAQAEGQLPWAWQNPVASAYMAATATGEGEGMEEGAEAPVPAPAPGAGASADDAGAKEAMRRNGVRGRLYGPATAAAAAPTPPAMYEMPVVEPEVRQGCVGGRSTNTSTHTPITPLPQNETGGRRRQHAARAAAAGARQVHAGAQGARVHRHGRAVRLRFFLGLAVLAVAAALLLAVPSSCGVCRGCWWLRLRCLPRRAFLFGVCRVCYLLVMVGVVCMHSFLHHTDAASRPPPPRKRTNERHGKVIADVHSGYENSDYIFRLFSQVQCREKSAARWCIDWFGFNRPDCMSSERVAGGWEISIAYDITYLHPSFPAPHTTRPRSLMTFTYIHIHPSVPPSPPIPPPVQARDYRCHAHLGRRRRHWPRRPGGASLSWLAFAFTLTCAAAVAFAVAAAIPCIHSTQTGRKPITLNQTYYPQSTNHPNPPR